MPGGNTENSKFRESRRDHRDHETRWDIIDDEEQFTNKTNSVTVTVDEWCVKFHGQDDDLQWLQEDVDDGSLTQTYKNTPWSSLNFSVACEENDETGYNKDQTSFGVMEDQQQNNRWNKRCMTNMEKGKSIECNECNRGATVNRQGEVKSDNQDHTVVQKTGIETVKKKNWEGNRAERTNTVGDRVHESDGEDIGRIRAPTVGAPRPVYI